MATTAGSHKPMEPLMNCSASRMPKSGQFWIAPSMMIAIQIMQGIGAVNCVKMVVLRDGWPQACVAAFEGGAVGQPVELAPAPMRRRLAEFRGINLTNSLIAQPCLLKKQLPFGLIALFQLVATVSQSEMVRL